MAYLVKLTATGAAKIAAQQVGGPTVNLVELAVGDGGGAAVVPIGDETELAGEVWRDVLASVVVDPGDASVIVAEAVLPSDEGGFWVRELGIFDDDGDLFAYGNFPESYKPVGAEGSSREMVVRAHVRVASTAAVQIVVDPTLVTATRAWCLATFLEKAENLADLPDKAAARTNLGIGDEFLSRASNLADLDDAAEARDNLGLGGVLSAYLGKAANLSDLTDARAARANVGLSDAEIFFSGAGF